jgi:uncharacterized protein (TIGR02453 family)
VTFAGFPVEAFEFYEGLEADNSKTYWTDHKPVYDEAIRAPMLALAAELEKEFGEAKLFRPNRDVRFSNDKSPYKTHQGLYFPSGYYTQIDSGGLMTAGGFYTAERPRVARFRAAIDNDITGKALERILAKLAKNGFEPDGQRVRTRPRGCPADHPRLDLMRHESLIMRRRYDVDARLGSRKALDLVRADWLALRPFNTWVSDHVPHDP